jgi:hypothetical protein
MEQVLAVEETGGETRVIFDGTGEDEQSPLFEDAEEPPDLFRDLRPFPLDAGGVTLPQDSCSCFAFLGEIFPVKEIFVVIVVEEEDVDLALEERGEHEEDRVLSLLLGL